MSEQKSAPRGRTFLAGKVISNYGQSSIDCIVRRISDVGAVIEVESVLGVPEHFHLLIPGEGEPQPCKRSWQSDKQIGLVFETEEMAREEAARNRADEARGGDHIVRGQMLALRAALDVMDVGVLLLDANMKCEFINRAFRRMWALPDAVADRNPAFVALMYHGRDTKAYEIAPAEIDAYVAERVRLVRAGDTRPLDLRRTNGDVVRMQCASLPNGGRMLSYTYVTDIVRHSDELEVLRSALDNVSEGVVMLDKDLNAQFLNLKMRKFWGVTEEQAATHPSYASLIRNSPHTNNRGMPPGRTECVLRGPGGRGPGRQRAVARFADPRRPPHPRALLAAEKRWPDADLLRRDRSGSQRAADGKAGDDRFDDGPVQPFWRWLPRSGAVFSAITGRCPC